MSMPGSTRFRLQMQPKAETQLTRLLLWSVGRAGEWSYYTPPPHQGLTGTAGSMKIGEARCLSPQGISRVCVFAKIPGAGGTSHSFFVLRMLIVPQGP